MKNNQRQKGVAVTRAWHNGGKKGRRRTSAAACQHIYRGNRRRLCLAAALDLEKRKAEESLSLACNISMNGRAYKRCINSYGNEKQNM